MSPKSDKQFEEIRTKSKDNIISAALSLFSEKGYFNTSVRQIAEKAKVSSGLMYNYFNSKEALLKAITNKALTLIDDIVRDHEDLSPEENVRRMIERFFNILDSQPKLLRMLLKISFQIDRFEFVKHMIKRKYDTSILEVAKDLKAMGYVDPEAEAALLIAAMDGTMYQALVLGEVVPVEHIKSQLIRHYSVQKEEQRKSKKE